MALMHILTTNLIPITEALRTKETTFDKHDSVILRDHVAHSYNVSSEFECGKYCDKEAGCSSFNIRTSSNASLLCEVNRGLNYSNVYNDEENTLYGN